jgi:hypothetical protein
LLSHGLNFRHLDPNLRPKMPKLRHLDPNFRPNMPKSRDLGPNLVGACSAQLRAKYGQVWPQQGQVGLKKARVQPASPAKLRVPDPDNFPPPQAGSD